MKTPYLQFALLVLPAAVAAAADAALLAHGGEAETISAVVLAASERNPILAAGVGMIYGGLLVHLYWRQGRRGAGGPS